MGKSKSNTNPFGVRRVVNGNQLAPKSLRKKGKKLLAECTEEELIKAGVK